METDMLTSLLIFYSSPVIRVFDTLLIHQSKSFFEMPVIPTVRLRGICVICLSLIFWSLLHDYRPTVQLFNY